jgi:signal transduction histidine kinase
MHSLARAVLVVVLCGIAADDVAAASAAAGTGQREVLVLYGTARDSRIATIGEREFPRLLGAGLNGALDYYSEFIDQGRFAEASYQDAIRDFLVVKYKRLRFDLVITMTDIATEFAVRYRDELFPGTPIVFFSESEHVSVPPNTTGVIGGLDLGGSVDLATVLQPDLRHLFVVTGSSPGDRSYEGQARAQLAPYAKRVDVQYLSGLRTADLLAKLSRLPDRSAVYYILVNQDATGENFQPLQYLDRVVAASNAPVYCWVDSAMDRGIIGGALKNQARETELLARLALRILAGETAGSIPVTTADLSVRQVDWRQLGRWSIPETRVPPGTIVRFRLPTLWDRYAIYIVGAAIVLLGQTVLIAGLLVQRARRREAEGQLRAQDTELRASYDRIHALGGRLLTAQETERTRIARELHDDVSQQLALLEMDLELLRNASADNGEQVREPLDRTREIARSVHDLSHRLHPARLRLVGLVPAIDGLRQESSRPELPITLTHDLVPRTLPPELTLCVFRVVQEALQNALKYSGASEVSIHLRGGDRALEVTVSDNGRGFDVQSAWGSGLGLISMSERLDALGGQLDVSSAPGDGTRVRATVPLAEAGRPHEVAS